MIKANVQSHNPIISWYKYWAERSPEHIAINSYSRKITYRELYKLITTHTESLSNINSIKPHKVIIENKDDTIEWFLALLYSLNVGHQVILPDTDWTDKDRNNHIKNISPTMTVMWQQENNRYTTNLINDNNSGLHPAGIWLFTSGTTQSPRAIFRSCDDISHMVSKLTESYPESLRKEKPTVVSPASLSHGFALINALFLTHSLGGTLIIPPPEERLLDTLQYYQANRLFAWPAHYRSLLYELKNTPTKLSNLTWCISSSFPANTDIFKQLSTYLDIPIRQQYGMTETGPLCINAEDEYIESINCVGKPLSGVTFLIVDNEGNQIENNQSGNITVKMDYYSPKELTSASENFFHTGDTGSLDDSGRLYILGRNIPFTDERREM